MSERRSQFREAGLPIFPEHYGCVTKASNEYALKIGKEREEVWNRKPPAKRAGYGTLGSLHPFLPNFDNILNEDSVEEVLINGRIDILTPWIITSPILGYMDIFKKSSNPSKSLVTIINAFRQQRSMTVLSDSPVMQKDLFNSALVNVRLDMLDRGSPGDMAIIYSLDKEERGEWLRALSKTEDGSLLEKSEIQRVSLTVMIGCLPVLAG